MGNDTAVLTSIFVFLVLCFFWGGWWRYSRQQGWSIKVYLTGCFLIAVFSLTVGGLAVHVYGMLVPEDLPETLQAAGLKGKDHWEHSEYNLASKIMMRDVDKTLPQLDDAVKRGDEATAINILLAFNERAGEWPSPYGNEQVDNNWRPCRLTILFFLQYAKDFSSKEYMLNNREACQKLVY